MPGLPPKALSRAQPLALSGAAGPGGAHGAMLGQLPSQPPNPHPLFTAQTNSAVQVICR